MRILFHKDFKKAFRKLSASLQTRCDNRLRLFQNNPLDPLLHNHALQGTYDGYRSINVTGDFRAVYKDSAGDAVEFVDIDTHHNLFGS